MPARFAEVVRAANENPFGGAAWAAKVAELRDARIDKLAMSLLEGGRVEDAERVVLGRGHLEAIEHPDVASAVLSEHTLPRSLLRRLPRPRAAYLRVAMAAGRCHRVLDGLAGSSEPMVRLRRETWAACFGDTLYHALKLERVIRDHDVLIWGETGTGKEAIAHALQEATPGAQSGARAPRAAVNAAAIPETLMESELFGHVRGSFTGATEHRQGAIRSADGGCFFLDEVGDLTPTTQVKLLRVMETDEVQPVGADTGHPVSVRYVAATHKDLSALVRDRAFRADLYHRLAGNLIVVPALRDRPEDIVPIGLAFVRRHLDEGDFRRERPTIQRWLESAEVRSHPFPGNVRELQNALRDVMLGVRPQLGSASESAPASARSELPARVRARTATMQEVAEWYLRGVLERTQGNYTEAARCLAMDRATVRRRARAVGL
jgi:transcriptional regulator with AAA-type ATPase domain